MPRRKHEANGRPWCIPSGSNWWWRTYIVLVDSYLRVIWGNNRRTNGRTDAIIDLGPQEGPTVAEMFKLWYKKICFFWRATCVTIADYAHTSTLFFCSTPNDGNCVDCLRNFQVYWTQNCVLLSQRKNNFSDFFYPSSSRLINYF